MNLLTKLPFIIVLYIIATLISCINAKPDKTAILKEYLISNEIETNGLENVLVLTEENCLSCTRRYALFIENQIENNNSIIVISAKGMYVDISPFLDLENRTHVIHDFKNEFEQLGITKGSSAVLLNDSIQIDTIIEIKAKGLDQTLSYLEGRLK